METPPEFKLQQFNEYILKALTVLDSISGLYTATNSNNFEISDDDLIKAFRKDEVLSALEKSNSEIGAHLDAYEKLTETGEIRLIMVYAYSLAKSIRSTLNSMYELMRDLNTVDKFQVRHFVWTIRSYNDSLKKSMVEFKGQF